MLNQNINLLFQTHTIQEDPIPWHGIPPTLRAIAGSGKPLSTNADKESFHGESSLLCDGDKHICTTPT